MDSITELNCCIAIYEFLIDETAITTNFGDCKTMQHMDAILDDNHVTMENFTRYLNTKYQMYETLEYGNVREFFSTTKGTDFYKTIIRNLKLELCLKDPK